MPTYDYECTRCGYTFEAFQKINDSPLTKCPKCNQKIKRLIGAGAGVIFKGSGFYATDYKKSKPAASSDSKSENACPKATERCKGCPAQGSGNG